MRIAVDFDGTVVEQDGRAYEDTTSPLRLMPGAREALTALRRAGHLLLLWSARASRALLVDPALDPLVAAGAAQADRAAWERSLPLNQRRLAQMVEFVATELPGVFHAVDLGMAGKPSVDIFIDDKALRVAAGLDGRSWDEVARAYGESPRRRASG